MFGKSEWMVCFHSFCSFSDVQAPKSMFLDSFVSYQKEILLFVYKSNKCQALVSHSFMRTCFLLKCVAELKHLCEGVLVSLELPE